MPADIDWDHLRREAVRAAAHAYAPYSRFPVGAAGLTVSGHQVSGCNVENASYGLSWCAECSMVAALVSSGGGPLAAVACRHGGGDLLLPCGRCRQVLFEFGGPNLLVDAPGGPRPLGELLVDAFGPDDLARRARRPAATRPAAPDQTGAQAEEISVEETSEEDR